MKKSKNLIVIICAIALLLAGIIVLFVCCGNDETGVIVHDYSTGEKINELNLSDDKEACSRFIDAMNSAQTYTDEIDESDIYSVLLKDPKDSTYDIWLKVVLFDGKVYVGEDLSKMDDEYAQKFAQMGFDGEYAELVDMTADEFESLMLN